MLRLISPSLRMSERQACDVEVRHIYEETAGSLAADRQTRTLPVVLAELFFIGGWVISLIKAASSEPGPTNWVNVEAQSIAISALYLWVTSTVVIASLIGSSQTEDSIPRILHDLEYKLDTFQDKPARRPSIAQRVDVEWCKRSRERAINGGTYSWRPKKWKNGHNGCEVKKTGLFMSSSIGIMFVGCSFFISATLSYLVSPQGFSCRHVTESIVCVFPCGLFNCADMNRRFGIWLLSFLVECACERLLREKAVFWFVFWKDMFCALSNIAIIMLIQWGIMNSCSCWSGWGSTWVHLPQIPEVKSELMYFIRHVAPWIVFAALMLHFLLCVAVIWWYLDAVRVFIQRDDGESNLGWWRDMWARTSHGRAWRARALS